MTGRLPPERSWLAGEHAPASEVDQIQTVIVVTRDRLFSIALEWALRRQGGEFDVISRPTFADACRAIAQLPESVLLLDGNPEDCRMEVVLAKARTSLRGPLVWIAPNREAALSAANSPHVRPIERTMALEAIAADILSLMQPAGAAAPSLKSPTKMRGNDFGEEPEQTLTPAQAKVLTLIEKGCLNKQIAYELGIVESTVKAHVSAIFRKLKVQNRVQATLAAQSLFA